MAVDSGPRPLDLPPGLTAHNFATPAVAYALATDKSKAELSAGGKLPASALLNNKRCAATHHANPDDELSTAA